MNFNFNQIITAATVSFIVTAALATSTHDTGVRGAANIAATSLPMVDAEIRKIDLENKKITLKHGEIKNLDMPGMTMVFQVKYIEMLILFQVGDKVKFTADKVNGAYTIMSIELAK